MADLPHPVVARAGRLHNATALALLTLTAACARAPEATPVPAKPAATAHAEVPWFTGDVEAAFAQAKAERKPLFLYWGAVWCPPCHYLKTKLFTRPEFVARMRGFVPVYLDGDTQQAQVLSERFGTEGYPTVIVFSPDGNEITRLPSMLPLEQYGAALDRALNATRPIGELVADIDAKGPALMAPADLALLAFYAWDQAAVDLDEAARQKLFARLWGDTSTTLPLEKSRFLSLYVKSLADADPVPVVADPERQQLLTGLLDLLADRDRRNVNLDLVLYDAETVVPLVAPTAGAERTMLAQAWVAAAQAIEADAVLSTDDRLSAVLPQIALARLDAAKDAPLPTELVAHVRERVKWADSEVKDDHELQAVMNTMTQTLEAVDLADESRELLSSRLADTLAPYYYMSHLAALEAQAGDKKAAVAHYKQAYEAARTSVAENAVRHSQGPVEATSQGADGAMTRFRWGVTYLRNAIKLTPEAGEQISADAQTIVGELLTSPDAFSGGNWTRLESLGEALAAWDGGPHQAAALAAIRSQVEAACARLAAGSVPATRCQGFKMERPAAQEGRHALGA